MVALNNVYQSHDNYETSIRVEHALIRSFPDRFLRVNASAFYGIVELSGIVPSLHDKSLAIQIAERVPGVTTVVESLRIIHDIQSVHGMARLRAGFQLHSKELPGPKPLSMRWKHD